MYILIIFAPLHPILYFLMKTYRRYFQKLMTNMARMAKNNNSRKLCYIEALYEFKNNKINKKK